MPLVVRRAGAAQLRTWDTLVLLWCTLWLVIGAGVGYEIWQLARLGGTLSTSGQAIDDSGRALQSLRDVPLVGGTTGTIGDRVRASGAQIVQRGRSTSDSTRRLAVLLGLTTALVPLAPVLLYLWARRAATSDRREVQTLADRVDGRELEAHLARRALAHVPYEVLLRTSPAPERDFAEGWHRALADAELARLGLSRDPAA